MKFPTKKVKSVESLLKNLREHLKELNEPVWFRGHADKAWSLESSFDRLHGTKNERDLINNFKKHATLILEKNINPNGFEWLFLMQHYGVPTRLLDWTESPLFGLYFVVSDPNFHDKDGILWALLPTKLNQTANYNYSHPSVIPSFDDEDLEHYLPQKLLQISGRGPDLPIAAIATRNNRRMQAQLSVFTISSGKDHPIDQISDQQHVWKYEVPSESKKNIFQELKYLAINEFSLFPELDRIWSSLQE
ncbi:FRG domain-containing protein [uncultured Methanoregula sp.]|uniref:FRG domain-containing protein n=1 Tax=uncultured Methanoregula sp. TaxID=1005933 RepID=UPI002AABB0A9|nr:FRG domain-containing protein [uncultured Methanoregula sp.]